jgi:hypothetical protein
MDMIFRLTTHFREEDFVLLMDAWDNEFKEYVLHLEDHCSKFMMGHIEWSPAIGILLNCCWLFIVYIYGCSELVVLTHATCFENVLDCTSQILVYQHMVQYAHRSW